MTSRRTFLACAGAAGALALYSTQRGLRYPRLGFEPKDVERTLSSPSALFTLSDVIACDTDPQALSLRAIAPEPAITLKVLEKTVLRFRVYNIAPSAKLNIEGKDVRLLDEEIIGLTRCLKIDAGYAQTLELNWALDANDGFDFAIIGDTGGGSELEWSLKRAHDLGATFLLHLGDFNYTEGEYQTAIEHFNNAPLPCYVSIGNHDFNDSGLVYQQFLQQIGPMNNAFELAGVRFVNIDSGADFFPASSGHRGRLLRELAADDKLFSDQVVFTHRPLKDPRPGDDHHITGIGEGKWVADMMHKINAHNFFNGHVHHSAELDVSGIHQYTVGEGLGHEDLIHQKQVAQLLMGRVERGQAVSYRWADLLMPWSAHLSPTHEEKLVKDNRPRQLEWYRQLLS